MSSIELFAGAGGLAMGMARAGFQHSAVVEWNGDACQTIRENRSHYESHGEDFVLFEGDARGFDFEPFSGGVEIISGGPPCQPFSLGGKHQGSLDERDMFPVAVQAVRQTMPKAFIFENVKGLLRQSFSGYFEYIYLQLSYPDVPKNRGETWSDHLARLEAIHTSGSKKPTYHVVFRLLNAANYGVPQKRERVFLVGFRADLGIKWSFPEPTHSEDQLLVSKWVTGDYWKRHKVPQNKRPQLSEKLAKRIARLAQPEFDCLGMKPWVTVRDAISDLPDPEKQPQNKILNHVYVPGARTYPGHTGSPVDEPSKTLKAGGHGVPGGENMLVRPDGSLRYFTVREAARIQTFPDDYIFHGSWGETMRQLGNAVPVKLAEVVAKSVANALNQEQSSRATKIC
ncbi:DNA (cytosine-5)-methyltransferase 1 [Pseudomonas sp. URMO17WK12:I6]|jgi:DNA (cytosine-5)-methyltransferase 1|uniref:DNA cytosine methyltransferase n=1 Tax=Pseudomonas sp. URMO17WK12:I6 TaxID=1261629 RepID=UPI000DAE8A6B|nr:DNA cytosine methyltransferase [Pseudomonas sp. URMO17WK12:I6]PZW52434.1 DNA (cytosine-5)-methyltransferase 1 [Pseudomonas sp. URMO17WK12:I6]